MTSHYSPTVEQQRIGNELYDLEIEAANNTRGCLIWFNMKPNESDPLSGHAAMSARAHGWSMVKVTARQPDWYSDASLEHLLHDAVQKAKGDSVTDDAWPVALAGLNMGASAALCYSRLWPDSRVLHIDGPSSMAGVGHPADRRYQHQRRRYQIGKSPFCDGRESLASIEKLISVYDPLSHHGRIHSQAIREVDPGSGDFIRLLGGAGSILQILKNKGAFQYLMDALLASEAWDCADFWNAVRFVRKRRRQPETILREFISRGHLSCAAKLLASSDIQTLLPEAKARQLLKDCDKRFHPYIMASDQSEKGEQRLLYRSADASERYGGEIHECSNAVMVPCSDGKVWNTGVLSREGDYIPQSRMWLSISGTTGRPPFPRHGRMRRLDGLHVFGGILRGHFGHFLVESLSRLWAFDKLSETPDSLIFLPFRTVQNSENGLYSLRVFLELLQIDCRVQILSYPTQVERLIIPDIGFGWPDRFDGSVEFRNLIRSRIVSRNADKPGRRLYLSRSRLGAAAGGVYGEKVIEEVLKADGYEIYHPQAHNLKDQMETYRQASKIVALDGSALHLPPFAVPDRTDFAVIGRRPKTDQSSFMTQIESFVGTKPVHIDAITAHWPHDGKGVDHTSVAQLDFAVVFRRLAETGFLTGEARIDFPSPQTVAADLSRQGRSCVPVTDLA